MTKHATRDASEVGGIVQVMVDEGYTTVKVHRAEVVSPYVITVGEESKKLTVSKTTYGVSNTQCVQLDFNNGAPIPTHEIHAANAWTLVTVLDSIDRAQRAGYTIEFVGFTADKVDAIRQEHTSEGADYNGKR